MHKDDKNLVEQGFTLVELLIVVVVLGILAGIVVFAVGNLAGEAENSACKTDYKTLETAIQAAEAKGDPVTDEAALVTGEYISEPSDYWAVDAGVVEDNGGGAGDPDSADCPS